MGTQARTSKPIALDEHAADLGKGWIMCNMANRSHRLVALCAALVLLSLVGHVLADAIGGFPVPILSSAREHRPLNSHAETDDEGDAVLPGLTLTSIKSTVSPLQNPSLKRAVWSFLPPVPPPLLFAV